MDNAAIYVYQSRNGAYRVDVQSLNQPLRCGCGEVLESRADFIEYTISKYFAFHGTVNGRLPIRNEPHEFVKDPKQFHPVSAEDMMLLYAQLAISSHKKGSISI